LGNPRLLLLDEPSEGLAPLIVKELSAQVQSLKAEDITILLCEQNPGFTLGLSDRAYILEKGHVRWQRDVSELTAEPEIMKTYLGV
jgi:branched-chain amino acid transport system ATP-binding protein